MSQTEREKVREEPWRKITGMHRVSGVRKRLFKENQQMPHTLCLASNLLMSELLMSVELLEH